MARLLATLLVAALALGCANQETTQRIEPMDRSEISIPKMWDFQDPAASEGRFREALNSTDDPSMIAELQTQIARTHSLRSQFDEAHSILDEVETKLPEVTPRARVRYALERGRTYNSAGEKEKARQQFLQAWNIALVADEKALAVDAAHMMGIAETPEKQIEWNVKAMEMAETSEEPAVRNWLGPLYNNLGWTYHDQGEFEKALELFEKGVEFRKEAGEPKSYAIARWCVARCYRSLGRIDEALEIQRELEAEHAEAGSADPYVKEELGELLWLKGEKDAARPYFAKAYELLSADKRLVENEPARLERLKRLGAGED